MNTYEITLIDNNRHKYTEIITGDDIIDAIVTAKLYNPPAEVIHVRKL